MLTQKPIALNTFVGSMGFLATTPVQVAWGSTLTQLYVAVTPLTLSVSNGKISLLNESTFAKNKLSEIWNDFKYE